MFFNEDHLRITKIRTVDGTTPVFDEEGRKSEKIIFAPKSKTTLKLFEDQNTRLPNHIKMKIEEVKAYKPDPLPAGLSEETVALQNKIAELEAQNKALKEQKASENGQKKAKTGTSEVSG